MLEKVRDLVVALLRCFQGVGDRFQAEEAGIGRREDVIGSQPLLFQIVRTEIEHFLRGASTFDRRVRLRIKHLRPARFCRRFDVVEPLPGDLSAPGRSFFEVVEVDAGDPARADIGLRQPFDPVIMRNDAGRDDHVIVFDDIAGTGRDFIVVRIERGNLVLDPLDVVGDKVSVRLDDVILRVKAGRHEHLSGLVEVDLVRRDDRDIRFGDGTVQSGQRHNGTCTTADD